MTLLLTAHLLVRGKLVGFHRLMLQGGFIPLRTDAIGGEWWERQEQNQQCTSI